MARRDEILEKKRTQAFLCAPSYKREIEELGNPGFYNCFTPPLVLYFNQGLSSAHSKSWSNLHFLCFLHFLQNFDVKMMKQAMIIAFELHSRFTPLLFTPSNIKQSRLVVLQLFVSFQFHWSFKIITLRSVGEKRLLMKKFQYFHYSYFHHHPYKCRYLWFNLPCAVRKLELICRGPFFFLKSANKYLWRKKNEEVLLILAFKMLFFWLFKCQFWHF